MTNKKLCWIDYGREKGPFVGVLRFRHKPNLGMTSASSNYKVQVFCDGKQLLTTVMGIESLEGLLYRTGAMAEKPVWKWVRIISKSVTPHQFPLNTEVGIFFTVTLTTDDIDYDYRTLG
ncbi:hypothetical protein [Rhizobium sp. 9140]|uniref:hypothetical protein n=1 Tax=Rhizobium sp. 9140 TaxID=1761900 RepID=UPI001586F5A0|nr:hypothetical protein [Rhizobium sp. 9140]